jgi:hypothetical protein
LPGAQLHTDGYDGQAKIVVDEDRHVMVGATFIGPQVGDLLHSATIAIVGQVPLERLWHAIPPFPTVNEIWISLLKNMDFDILVDYFLVKTASPLCLVFHMHQRHP